MDNSCLIINCRGDIIKIPKFEIEFLKTKDNFLSKMLLIDSNGCNEITIWEDKNVVLSIIDSLRLNKLIIHKDVDRNHYIGLCKKWNINFNEDLDDNLDPNIEEKLTSKIKAINHVYDKIFNPPDATKECVICHLGYSDKDNHDQSCRTHEFYKIVNGSYECCNSLEPCKIGKHVAVNRFFENKRMFIDILSKLF